MIPVSEIYDIVKAEANSTENGVLTYGLFNTFSKDAEVKAMKFMTGGVAGEGIPINFNSQKTREILEVFIAKKTNQVNNGVFPKPGDFYTSDVFYMLGSDRHDTDCDNISGINTMIEVLDGVQYQNRTTTFIDEIKPDINGPVAKIVDGNFVTYPKDLGLVCLEYIREPKYANIVSKIDPLYNIEVIDTALSENYEWHVEAKGLLVWFIKQSFVQYNGNQASKAANNEAAQTALK